MDSVTQEILDALNVRPEDITVFPDGHAFAVTSFPLPKDHWIYRTDADGFSEPPPMPWRIGEGTARDILAEKVREAARYAVRASTMHGKEMDFDPDAMVKNFVVGLLGYWTGDGLRSEVWANPDPVPPLYEEA